MNTDINRKLETNELIYQIVFLIINREDYKSAAQILINYEITIEEVSNNTLKLTTSQISTLSDNFIILKKERNVN